MSVRFVVAFLGILGLTAGSAHPAGAAQRNRVSQQDPMATQSIDTTFRMERGGLVDLELMSGDIIVTGTSGNQVRVRATSEEGRLTLRTSSTLATLRVERDHGRDRDRNRDRGRSNDRYEISVPAGVRVVMQVMSGSLTARGVDGDVDASAVSGNVELHDIGGIVNVEVVSGQITTSGLRSGIHVETTSGPVLVTDVDGEVLIENTSGHVTLRDIRSRLVSVESVSGDIRFDGTIEAEGRYEFETHSGTIRLALPPAVGAQLKLSTFSGSIQSEFPITLDPRARSSEKRIEFRLGSGGASLTAETFSGSISITRGTTRDRQE
jgi:DUF4097 and DUF4098 domain-containing protein YvlB